MKKLKIVMPLLVVVCMLGGCQDKGVSEELERFKEHAQVEAQNIEVVRRYVDAINRGEFEALTELMSPDFAIYSPSGYKEPTSREDLVENYKGALETFSEFTWGIEDIFAKDDKVVTRIMVKGRYKGGVPGLPDDPVEFEFSMIDIMRLEKRNIVEEWQEDDQLGFARQLGMELRPKGTVK
jgi:predicted ester cyclase